MEYTKDSEQNPESRLACKDTNPSLSSGEQLSPKTPARGRCPEPWASPQPPSTQGCRQSRARSTAAVPLVPTPKGVGRACVDVSACSWSEPLRGHPRAPGCPSASCAWPRSTHCPTTPVSGAAPVPHQSPQAQHPTLLQMLHLMEEFPQGLAPFSSGKSTLDANL